jgi:hypothetical protein
LKFKKGDRVEILSSSWCDESIGRQGIVGESLLSNQYFIRINPPLIVYPAGIYLTEQHLKLLNTKELI